MNLFILGFGNDMNYIKHIHGRLKNTIYVFPFDEKQNIDEIISNNIEGIFNVIGFSLGSIIVLDIVKRYNDRINKVILFNIPSYTHLLWSYNINLLKNLKYAYSFLPKWMRKYIYKYYINPHSPNMVLKRIGKYNTFAYDLLFEKLFEEDTFRKITNIKYKQIHLVSGYYDEYSFFSNFLQSYFDNIILHKYNGNHHIILNDPLLFCCKIEKILN